MMIFMKYRTIMHPDGTLERISVEKSIEDKQQVILLELSLEERRALTDEKLNYLLQTSYGALLLSAIKEAKDRDDGKPIQRLDAKVTTRSVHLHIGNAPKIPDIGGNNPVEENAKLGM